MKTHDSWCKADFIKYLISERSISKTVASNYASRCRRVESSLSINLISATKNAKSYKNLLIKINGYAEDISRTVNQRYSIGGTLRLAVKRFAEFNGGSSFANVIDGHRVKLNKSKK